MSQTWASSLVELYQTKGINAVEQSLEKKLQEVEYWNETIDDRNVSLGYYEGSTMVIVVDKSKKTLKLYDPKTDNIKAILNHEIITGLLGDKQKEGDLKTPMGVYNLVKRFVPGDPFYGQIAYALSYPNALDKQQGKTGHGIWIHGHPLDNTPRYTKNTEGCVVMTNDLLETFDQKIKNEDAIAIISENDFPKVDKAIMSDLLSQIFQWRNSWKYSNTKKYLTFYHEDFKRFNGDNIKEFSRMKKLIFSRKEDKKILFQNLMVVPYPDEEYESMFRVSYYQVYETKNHQFYGGKEIYLTFKDNKMKILMEK